MLRVLNTITEFDELLQNRTFEHEQARVEFLCEHVVWDEAIVRLPPNPFSAEYREAVLQVHQVLSRRPTYLPAEHEQTPIDPAERARRPGIYTAGDSRFLGDFMEATGHILKTLNVGPGARVLEYGPGDGQIALALARMGCEVTVVDVEPRYLEAIQRQAASLDVQITTICAEFNAELGLSGFDCVLFFEAFHHALDHAALVDQLHAVIADEGRIVFSGEPILERGNYYSQCVPFPWGLRLDALSLSQVRNLGWMELGYQEGYFVEMLMRGGWLVRKAPSLSTTRGTCWVAEKMGGQIDFTQPYLFQITFGDSGWHDPEPMGRWTAASAKLPLPLKRAGSNITVRGTNRLSQAQTVTFRSGAAGRAVAVEPHRPFVVALPSSELLEIEAGSPLRPSDHGALDSRLLGVMIESLEFEPTS